MVNEKKQNPVVIVILIAIIIGAVYINIKRFRKPRRVTPRVSTPTTTPAPSVMPQKSISARPASRPAKGMKKRAISVPTIKVNLVSLTSGVNFDTQPVFSPNGREIAFVSFNKNEGQNIYILKVNGNKKPVRLTHGNYIDSHPSWSPDGKKIVFSSNRGGKEEELFWVDKFTGEITPLNKEGGSPSISPDGEWLSFVYRNNIWIMRLATKEFTPLTKKGYNDWPSWSRDNKKIYFCNDGCIKVFNLETSELTSLTSTGFNDHPAVSPSGDKLAYISLDSGAYDLWMMDVGGGNKVQLTGDMAREYFPSWSPDGKSIVFASDIAGLSHLYLLTLLE